MTQELTDAEVFGTPAMADVDAELRARRAANPGGFDATMNRVFTGAVTGLPDLGIGIYNAGARALGYPGAQASYLGPHMIEAGGGGQLPRDASTARRLLEGAVSALLGGGAGAAAQAVARSSGVVAPAVGSLVTTTVAPTVGSHYGGEAGSYIANKVGADPETGALLGSIAGGVAGGGAGGAAERLTHNRFAARARPDAPEIAAAASRQDVTPTAGMLGNADIQLRERQFANLPGAMDYIQRRRQTAAEQMSAALDRAAAARGSRDAAPTPGTIGYDVTEVARTGRDRLGTISSTAQQDLMNRVGPRTEADVANVLAAIEDIRNRTDPGTAAPVDARLATLRQMLPRDDEGNIVSTTVPYERLKDWRTGLGRRSQSLDPVPGRFADEIYGETTNSMRQAGESQGVPAEHFNQVQAETRRIMGEDGPYQQLDAVANSEPTAAFNYLRSGEQNPARLRTLQDTGLPDVDRIAGDYVRMLGTQTLGTAGARGPINFANRWEGMTPGARDVFGGPQVGNINDVATLARSFDYPTSQTGLGRTTGPLADSVGRALTAGEVGASLGSATGVPGGTTAGRIAGYALMPALRAIQARILQGDLARNAMSGGSAPPVMTMSELVAALNAAGLQQQQRGGPRIGLP